MLDLCLEAERRLKRVRQERWGPRLIDIDILVFGDRAVHENGLEIPHPRMLERAFVLAPLAEIAPDFVAGGKQLSDHLAACRHGWHRAAAVRPRLVEGIVIAPSAVTGEATAVEKGLFLRGRLAAEHRVAVRKTSEPLDDVAVLDRIA